MRAWSILLAFALYGVSACAQEPAHPGQLFSSDLVAWSFMQQPQQPEHSHSQQQPTPDPTPETQPSPNPTPAQPGAQQTSPAPQSTGQTPVAQSFTGTIDKEGDSYVLKVADSTSYKLDNQQAVEPYSGRRVQVTGTLDRAINLIHVDKVEPLS
ncbi:MAG TPA: DUF5818 domain-containing protein [Terriglobales bacterium]|nr:DUF5818 domain-containing protein [Terriglobales bacterium]